MTSHPPPSSYSPIFNPLSYTIEDGFLTLAEADNRYFKRTGGVISGLATFNAGLYSTAQINITANTDSTSVSTGSLITAGGIGIAKTLYVGTGIENFDGTVTNPAYSFANNTNTGIYRIGTNNLGISCNGVKQVDISTALVTFTSPLRLSDGGWTFSSSTNTGFTYTGANRILVSNAGVQTFVFSNGGINQSVIPLACQNGTAAAPGLRGLSYSNTGLFWKSTPSLAITTNGVERVDFSSTAASFSTNINMNNNNILNAQQVGNTAGNLEIAVNSTGAGGTITLTGGTDLLQGSAGGSAGVHLKLIINGTAYKIALLNN